MMDFNDTKTAFSMKSMTDLRNAQMLFTAIQNPVLVKSLKYMTNLALKVNLPVAWVVKPTLYRQFVGGENLQECEKIVDLLRTYNIKSVLDYSAEGGSAIEDVSRAFNETMRSIEFAKGKSNIAYTVFKPTAMIIGSVLSKATVDINTLNEVERAELDNFKTRVTQLCQRAYDNDVRILIDAEHYATQGIIDTVAETVMRKFNNKRAIVFQTLQMYRTDRLEYLKYLFNDSKEYNYIPGIKFVRGAYMDEERALASRLGYPDPIHPDKYSTDKCYDSGLKFVMENIESFELFSGTHNYQSNMLLADLIDAKGLRRDDQRVFFSQLYGMSDNISFNLAAEGFNVCKYIPYAPVRDVLPYLLRRAEENTSMAGQTGRELQLIREEIARRRG
ncbi:MAG: proline dehydrogenase [Bacteroidetes bacterium GWF2_41_61]|nr:MAG: proline dehydrogenase [Bacteroidetes bacterium GWF2_41_61]OFY89227.1 MAG: proline dehydrogenase [Bacteroidetes bacterium RIFOXYA12_FULL_40_10]